MNLGKEGFTSLIYNYCTSCYFLKLTWHDYVGHGKASRFQRNIIKNFMFEIFIIRNLVQYILHQTCMFSGYETSFDSIFKYHAVYIRRWFRFVITGGEHMSPRTFQLTMQNLKLGNVKCTAICFFHSVPTARQNKFCP